MRDYVIRYYLKLPERHQGQVRDILMEANQDFLPPLSERSNTSGDSFGSAGGYIEETLKQSFAIAEGLDGILGFISFIPTFHLEGVGNCVYLTTGVVRKNRRGMGLGHALLKSIIESADGRICTRTWSTNNKSNRILDSAGFVVVKVIKNHRAEGIDTLYYGIGEEKNNPDESLIMRLGCG